MTYVETDIRDGQRGDSLGCHMPTERPLLLGDPPATR
jgi:hypothetical protein